MPRNPTWTRDELILALELYLRHRERLPDSDDAEIIELSQTLNSLFGDQAKDANLFRNPNGVYMKLANFRAVDPVHTSQGKRGLSRGGHGVGEIWEEFSTRFDELKLIATAIRAAAADRASTVAEGEEEGSEAEEGRLLTRMHRVRERNRDLVRRKRDAVLRADRTTCLRSMRFRLQRPVRRTWSRVHRSASSASAPCACTRHANADEGPCRPLRQLPSHGAREDQVVDAVGVEGPIGAARCCLNPRLLRRNIGGSCHRAFRAAAFQRLCVLSF